MTESTEDLPREKGSVPEGAEVRADGSYVLPSDEQTMAEMRVTPEHDAPQVDDDEDGEDEELLSEQANAELPREHGTQV